MLSAQLQEDRFLRVTECTQILERKYTPKCIKSKKDQSMTKKLAIVLALSTTAACNTSTGNLPFESARIDCSQTNFEWEYERISCEADKEKAERVKKTFESAIIGAGIGAIVASATNEDPKKAIIAGALIAGLGAHWQSAQKEMELRELSAKQRERHLNSLAIKRTQAATKKIRILKSEAKKAEKIQDLQLRQKRISGILAVANKVEAEAAKDAQDSSKLAEANGVNLWGSTLRKQVKAQEDTSAFAENMELGVSGKVNLNTI